MLEIISKSSCCRTQNPNLSGMNKTTAQIFLEQPNWFCGRAFEYKSLLPTSFFSVTVIRKKKSNA